MQDLSLLQVDKLVSLNHAEDSKVNGFCILESLEHFLLKLRVGDFSADSDSALDSLFDLSDHGHKLDWGLNVFGSHATLGSVQGGNLEDAVSLLDMLHLDLVLEMNPGYSL